MALEIGHCIDCCNDMEKKMGELHLCARYHKAQLEHASKMLCAFCTSRRANTINLKDTNERTYLLSDSSTNVTMSLTPDSFGDGTTPIVDEDWDQVFDEIITEYGDMYKRMAD